jgi:hypothetical protein
MEANKNNQIKLEDVAIKDIVIGDRIYDFKLRKYDEVAFIEKPNNFSNEYFITWKSFDDGLFGEEWKDFSDYFSDKAVLSVLKEDSTSRQGRHQNSTLVPTIIEYISVGDVIYLEEEKKEVYIKDIAHAYEHDSFTLRTVREATYEQSNGEDYVFNISGKVSLRISLLNITQSEKNS